MPDAGDVYLVNPSVMARIPASLMFCGVSKSGSPADKAMTSIPSRFMAAALADIAIVDDGSTLLMYSDKGIRWYTQRLNERIHR